MKIFVTGGCGFIGSKFKEMNDSQVEIQSRDERVPKNNDILYRNITITILNNA